MRIGLACREITPPFATTMWGYGARLDHFDEVNDPLTFTAIVLEEGSRRALIGAADLGTFPAFGSAPSFHERLAQVVGCPVDNIMLNASHTHGGPTIAGDTIFGRMTRDPASATRYRAWLLDQVAAAAQEAVEKMFEATLWFGEGKTAFPMNRRLERNGRVDNAPWPQGPIDDRMQVMVIRNNANQIAGLGMRLSCHPVATGAQHLLTADYPGAWRAEVSKAFGPAVTPFFLQGAGADTRPHHAADGDHWRQLKHAELPAVGRELLSETLAIVTSGKLRQINGLVLQGKISTAKAPCEKRFTKPEQLKPWLNSEDPYQKLYAEECIKLLKAGKRIDDHADFHVQTLWLNREFALIGLDAEPLLALGRFVESAVAPRQAMLLGYTNGCLGYTPDTAEMKRGGYETTSYLFHPWSGPLMPGLEGLFAASVARRPESQSKTACRRKPKARNR
jgi:neutral ceramidase